jgi:hypothetical protein
MLDPKQIREVCAAYTARDWWVHRDIPADRLKTARESWKVPPEGAVVAFLDATVFGSGKTGLAVMEEGVAWNSGITGQRHWWYPWEEFGAPVLRLLGPDVQIGRGVLQAAGAQMKRDDLLACLRRLQELARAAGAPSAVAFVPEGFAFPAAGQPPAGAEELKRLMDELGGTWLRAAPDIPPKKERNAREAMRIPPGETVIALADATIFGSAKAGFAVGRNGIYWHNSIVGGNDRGWLAWSELARLRVSRAAALVSFSETDWINPAAGHEDATELFLLGLQWWARARMAPEPRRAVIHAAGEVETAPPPPLSAPGKGAAVWHLAANGQQFGPYDAGTVATMAAAGQVDAATSFAWSAGMPEWLPLARVTELASLLAPPPPPVPAAPPISPAATPPPAVVDTGAVTAAAVQREEDEGRVDVNAATVQDLLVLPGVTAQAAQRLIDERQARGGFRDVEQIGELLRLPPHRVEQMRAMVSFGRAAAPRGRVVDF